MGLITLDMETFYDTEYSLSKLSEIDYIMSPKFECIMCSIKVGSNPTRVFVGYDKVAKALAVIDWSKSAMLSHNIRFDGSAVAWHFGHVPAMYLCSLSMARATTHWTIGRSSLAKVAEYLGLPAKGDEVVRAKGKRLIDFTDAELDAYRSYCARDTDLCHAIFTRLKPHFRASEILLIDLVARMFITPQVKLNAVILQQNYERVLAAKKEALLKVVDIPKPVFSSNPQFAALLESYGVEVPLKVSPTTGNMIPALAKGDWAFKELCADDTQPIEVQALLAARQSVKSTLEETRSLMMLSLSKRQWLNGYPTPPGLHPSGTGWAPIPLKFSGARTHRLSGDGGANWQNLPRGSLLRTAIEAPAGYRIVHRDASQIEARMVAWMAKCWSLLDAFAQKRDVYSEFARIIYGKDNNADVTKLERFVGKTCLAAGTRVLTTRGPIAIENVTTTDMLWDGVEWVHHGGLLAHGLRETLTLSGVSLTPDHLVLSGKQWLPASAVGLNGHFHTSAIAVASLSLLDTCWALEAASNRFSSSATAADPSTPSTVVTSRTSEAPAATNVLKKLLRRNAIGNTPTQCRTTRTALACLIGWLRQLLGAGHIRHDTMFTTAYAEFTCALLGLSTAPNFSGTFRPWQGGTTPHWKWIGSTITGITNRVTSSSQPVVNNALTSAISPLSKPVSANLKPVYDLANAGPRHRFTILSSDGPVIVANSILGLGYGCGAEKFRKMLFIGNGGISLKVEFEEAEQIVLYYRSKYPEIPRLWTFANHLLRNIIRFTSVVAYSQTSYDEMFSHIPVSPDFDSLTLPNGLKICYPELRTTKDMQMHYTDPQRNYPIKMYGAKCVENISQALSRIIVTDIAIRMLKTGYRPFLTTHDSLCYCVPLKDAEVIDRELARQFEHRPAWAPDLPLASDGGWGKNLTAAERGAND